mmetsp:Transcript_35212/g.42405  ORF Transcript_35212/g.42405 Transcript_35212/m.42405 type:complete len:291 (+) Transcript_35212:95-967(+)|eukprot:CAMPEP_0197845400 /NCGR_PEP_ID=MMETSP1438-20131217/2334_1 /TAXON_ID=1461541 /ORGANISM="Pterosperma sp., Strain CCMP1384" /LENGTH=290 /DNA_ID=CAMNT_0043456681 /DNA_START=95 /DNA_END=967 /DNA_ORIENTATION=-
MPVLVQKEGYLKKRHANTSVLMRNWNTRWFSLSGDSLEYRKTEEDDRSKGEWSLLDLESVQLVQDKRVDKDSQTEFELVFPERSLVLKADTPQVAQDWVFALNRAASQGQAPPEPRQPVESFNTMSLTGGNDPYKQQPPRQQQQQQQQQRSNSPRSRLSRPSLLVDEEEGNQFDGQQRVRPQRVDIPSHAQMDKKVSPNARQRMLNKAEEEVLSFDDDVDDGIDIPPPRSRTNSYSTVPNMKVTALGTSPPTGGMQRHHQSHPTPTTRHERRTTEGTTGQDWLEDDWDSD